MTTNIDALDDLPRASLSHYPTPIEEMPNLGKQIGVAGLYIKRDDCTGLAMGGNKARQLEFYFGEAVAKGADTVLITGAVQSNYTRMSAAAAAKFGMECHIQAENLVATTSESYRNSGNVLISRILGAKTHAFCDGENEEAADRGLEKLADQLKRKGRRPYIIHLGLTHRPLGALGYVVAAGEIIRQTKESGIAFDEIVVASGSGSTHAGLLFGLRAFNSSIAVTGICVRRPADLQKPRIFSRCRQIADLLKMDNPVSETDVIVNDDAFAPGYGRINDLVREAIRLTARREGILLDPAYTGKAMAGFLDRARQSPPGRRLLFLHTGGHPGVFAYETELGKL